MVPVGPIWKNNPEPVAKQRETVIRMVALLNLVNFFAPISINLNVLTLTQKTKAKPGLPRRLALFA